MVVIRGGGPIGGSTSIRGQVRGLFMRVFDLAAAAIVIDIGRHQAEINFGHTAS